MQQSYRNRVHVLLESCSCVLESCWHRVAIVHESCSCCARSVLESCSRCAQTLLASYLNPVHVMLEPCWRAQDCKNNRFLLAHRHASVKRRTRIVSHLALVLSPMRFASAQDCALFAHAVRFARPISFACCAPGFLWPLGCKQIANLQQL